MVHFEVTGGVDPLLTAHMQKGDKVLAEANAMVAMQDGLSLKGRSRGGLFKSLARKLLNDEKESLNEDREIVEDQKELLTV